MIDTGALLYEPDLIYKMNLNDTVVIPTAVIKELDICKSSTVELEARAARDVARTLDQLGSYLDLAKGGQLQTGTILRTFTRYKKIKDLGNDIDNRVVGTALELKGEFNYVAIVSTDEKMRAAARAHGLKAKNYPFSLTKDKVTTPACAPKKAQPSMAMRSEGFLGRVIRLIKAVFSVDGGRRPVSRKGGNRS